MMLRPRDGGPGWITHGNTRIQLQLLSSCGMCAVQRAFVFIAAWLCSADGWIGRCTTGAIPCGEAQFHEAI